MPSSGTFDLAIVGGGPAGLATAIFAAQSGLTAAVFEKRRPPLDKACGEGLMPSGVELLQEMGVELSPPAYRPFNGIRYIDGTVQAVGRFRAGPGWGIRRTSLAESMAQRAGDLGVELHLGRRAEKWIEVDGGVRLTTSGGEVEARVLVGADGLHSGIRKTAGLEEPSTGGKRFGVRRHFEISPWTNQVVVHWIDGAEAYLTPVGESQVGIAILWEGKDIVGDPFEHLLGRFPALAERFAGVPYSSGAKGAGPFRQTVRRRHRGRVALVGDAAGYLDAITGEGLSLGFASARALVAAVERRDLNFYEKEYRRLSRAYYVTTELLLWAAKRPRARRLFIKTLARAPKLFDFLLEWVG